MSKATGKLFTSLLLFVAQIIYILSLAIYKVKIKTFEVLVVRNFFGQHFHPLLFTAIAASYINTLDEFNLFYTLFLSFMFTSVFEGQLWEERVVS